MNTEAVKNDVHTTYHRSQKPENKSFVLVANIGFDTAENKAFKVSRKLLPSSYRGREKRSGGQERLHERLPVAMEAQHCRELVGVEVVQPGRA